MNILEAPIFVLSGFLYAILVGFANLVVIGMILMNNTKIFVRREIIGIRFYKNMN